MESLPARILLATDGSKGAQRAARVAVEIAKKSDSELHLVHVGEFLPPLLAHTEAEPARLQREARRLLDERTGRISSYGRPATQTHLRLGAADNEIVAVAKEIGADLIATGSRGRDGLRRVLMGSVSDSVMRHTHCPVLVVRSAKGKEE